MFLRGPLKRITFNPLKLPRAQAWLLEDPAVPANLTAKACDDPLRKLLYQQAPYQESFAMQHAAGLTFPPDIKRHLGPEGVRSFVNFTTNLIVYNKLLSR